MINHYPCDTMHSPRDELYWIRTLKEFIEKKKEEEKEKEEKEKEEKKKEKGKTQLYIIIDRFGSHINYSVKENKEYFIIKKKSSVKTLIKVEIEKEMIYSRNKPRNLYEMNEIAAIFLGGSDISLADLTFIYCLLYKKFQIIKVDYNGLIYASIEISFEYLNE